MCAAGSSISTSFSVSPLLWESHLENWSNPIKHTSLPPDLFNRVHQDTAGHLSLSPFVFLEGIYIFCGEEAPYIESCMLQRLQAAQRQMGRDTGMVFRCTLRADSITIDIYSVLLKALLLCALKSMHCTRKHLWGMQRVSPNPLFKYYQVELLRKHLICWEL